MIHWLTVSGEHDERRIWPDEEESLRQMMGSKCASTKERKRLGGVGEAGDCRGWGCGSRSGDDSWGGRARWRWCDADYHLDIWDDSWPLPRIRHRRRSKLTGRKDVGSVERVLYWYAGYPMGGFGFPERKLLELAPTWCHVISRVDRDDKALRNLYCEVEQAV